MKDTYDKSLPFAASIRWIKKETRDTLSFALRIEDEHIRKAYAFAPGQFNMLSVPGVGEAPISISSGPSDDILLHTIRVAGDVTTALSRFEAGNVLGVRGPFGNGWPMERAEMKRLLIIAGGLGIAPLRPVLRYMLKNEKPNASPAEIPPLIYGARSPRNILFHDEFRSYAAVFDVHITVDKADPQEHWSGNIGLMPPLLDKISLSSKAPDTTAFICGPEVMMRCLIEELLARGLRGENIFLSMERNMNCGMGTCGHCMFAQKFVCKDGPVFRYQDIAALLAVKEL